jgi:hypothetical protein
MNGSLSATAVEVAEIGGEVADRLRRSLGKASRAEAPPSQPDFLSNKVLPLKTTALTHSFR